MKIAHPRAVICTGHFKTAALYFDQVIPLSFGIMGAALQSKRIAGYIDHHSDDTHELSVLAELLKEARASRIEIISVMYGRSSTWDDYLRWHDGIEDYFRSILPEDETDDPRAQVIAALTGKCKREAYAKLLSTFGLQRAGLFIPNPDAFTEDIDSSDVMLKLVALPLANTESADFSQIVETRKDKDALRKLRRLRSFASIQYGGKELAQIEDDLLRRLDDHQQAAKKHGFDLITSSISAVIDAKNLQASAAAALAGAFVGGSLGAITAAVLIEIASITVTIAKGNFQYHQALDNSDVAFLHEIVEPLQGSNGLPVHP